MLLLAVRGFELVVFKQEYTTITNISTAAMTVLPLPNPGARLSLEINEPLGLHMPSGSLDMPDQVRYIVYKVITAACNRPELG